MPALAVHTDTWGPWSTDHRWGQTGIWRWDNSQKVTRLYRVHVHRGTRTVHGTKVGQQPESHVSCGARAQTPRDCPQYTGEVRPVCRGGAKNPARKSHVLLCTCTDIQRLSTAHSEVRRICRGGSTSRKSPAVLCTCMNIQRRLFTDNR